MSTNLGKQERPEPHAFKRRVLLAVTGLSPQVVTETLYALAVKRVPPFIPTEVRLITTEAGRREARLNLLAARRGWFHRLRNDYRLPAIAFGTDFIHVLADASGKPLDDIRSPSENERAADLIVETVRSLTADPASALHVSIAGGRKTMGYYLGYALSLYGRVQDRLSHVLVSEPFESNRDFYYPTPVEHAVRASRDGTEQTFDAKLARVDLAEIPFVRLRDVLPPHLRDGRSAFSRTVVAANRGLEPPRLTMRLSAHEIKVDDEAVRIGSTDFAVLLWLAQRTKRKMAALDWSTPESADEFLRHSRLVIKPASGEYQRIEDAIAWRRNSPIKLAKYFEPHKSRINKAIERRLGSRAAARYCIVRIRDGRGARYFLPLDASQIEVTT